MVCTVHVCYKEPAFGLLVSWAFEPHNHSNVCMYQEAYEGGQYSAKGCTHYVLQAPLTLESNSDYIISPVISENLNSVVRSHELQSQ